MNPSARLGRKLIVRDFVFDSASQKEISAVMEELPPDVIIFPEEYAPMDYYPHIFRANPRDRSCGRP